ncbi:MAG: pirin family protein [Nitrososphaeraceae archaeon]|nr:pirin family protein [Nitrososphaeraceae archaeon]
MTKINFNKIKDIEQEQKYEYKQQTLNTNNLDPVHTSIRSVLRVIKSQTTSDGEGVKLNRSFPNNIISDFDPFLLLDEIGPTDMKPGNQKGFPDHPHRGFETVTYLLEGKFEHRDSQGHSGIISGGDVQWMTAGSGVIHSEMPEKEFSKKGGKLHGFQLWVNLPQKNKMMKPRYQEISKTKIPIASTKDGNVSVKVIAGESLGAKAVVDTITPIIYLHFKLEPGSSIVQSVPGNYNVFAYIIRGSAEFEQSDNSNSNSNSSDSTVGNGNLVIFDKDGNEVYIQNSKTSKTPLELLLIGGIPLNEQIARYGPFVMNTQQEIYQAVEDYRNGKLG